MIQPSPSFEKQASLDDPLLEMLVPELVQRHAVVRPDGTAAVQGDVSLTYGELDERSGQLAHHLRQLGVGPETVVGLCIKRSVAMIIAALGIMKAGGAYLPIDPGCPPSRVDSILRDAGVAVLIGPQCGSDKLPAGAWKLVELDAEGRVANRAPGESFSCKVEPHHLAYVIYTSGSTGQPKGVEVTHANLRNLVLWHQTAFDVTAADRASLLSSPGFDAAVWEIWPYLTAGATINIPEEDLLTNPPALRDWIVAKRVTISFVPTPVAERLMALPWPAKTDMRFLLTGADVLRRYPPARLPFVLVNNYGPTECTVVASSGIVAPEARSESLPAIGRPIANTQIHILDESLRSVSAGTTGEIYIGGAGVARGYRCRPDLTAERFISDPFSPASGARLYRTGDRARYLANGEIEFLGRIDDQIKIHGFRIEPNEIAAALAKHPSVRECFVIARELSAGEKQLVAYVVLDREAIPTDTALRGFLATQVPEYMIPSAFVQLQSLPLNANGKIDRNALPAPDVNNSLQHESYVAPRTAIEQRLAAILAPLLNLDHVGVEDNFFLLGGHSLLGTQLIGRIRDAFGVELSLRIVFEASTIASLAAEIETLLLAKIESLSEEEALQMLNTCEQGDLQENVA
jgi:amino acid adenylation domain-containing protein